MTGPLRRRGPRPLPLHLGLAGMRAMAAASSLPATPWPSAWPNSSAAWPISKAGQAERDRILGALAAGGHGPEAFGKAVLTRLARADRALIAGMAAYRRHPWTREMADPPVLWSEGGSRLLDFGGEGPAVLFVPSLVNRAYVLDLTPERSLMRWLPGQGFRTLLLDWGWPGEAERNFTLTDYVAGRLERALMAAPGPVVLAGYCMGGLLALAAALRRPDRVHALALLATPWDFHAGPDGPRRARTAAALLPGLDALMEPTGALPVDAIQSLFAMLDPYGVAQKFRAFARLRPDSERASLFVALEDWLNDGVPLPAPIARQCLGGWYGRNEPGRLVWRIAGQIIDPAAWAGPVFTAMPERDRIVPPASAMAAALRFRQGDVHVAAGGHIGMVAGTGAESALWQPMTSWLRRL
ncbi:alpha/beta fold hydrolase [Roseomonas sp. HJA6]|uniref:Alpha/beta fold hydrolase n=1 Tax=Roseomonas alba TaxID=2846776 RepID=A0ABS7A395_9PROT|nr:alpha/beta fold hydrolase [Neoroseomonas alba]MBW6396766.1 alpha/beta fold hydrolase [Neoroseomonas alba]